MATFDTNMIWKQIIQNKQYSIEGHFEWKNTCQKVNIIVIIVSAWLSWVRWVIGPVKVSQKMAISVLRWITEISCKLLSRAQTQPLKQTFIWFQTQENLWVSNPNLFSGFVTNTKHFIPEKGHFLVYFYRPIQFHWKNRPYFVHNWVQYFLKEHCTASWGPRNHSKSPPGGRPMFLKPKFSKEYITVK